MASKLVGLILWIAGITIATYYSAWAVLQLVSSLNVDLLADPSRLKKAIPAEQFLLTANFIASTAHARARRRNRVHLLVHYSYRSQDCKRACCSCQQKQI